MNAARQLALDPRVEDVVATVEQLTEQAHDAVRAGRIDEAQAVINLANDVIDVLRNPPVGEAPAPAAFAVTSQWMRRANGETLAHRFTVEVEDGVAYPHLRPVCNLVSRRGESWAKADSSEDRCEHCRRGNR